MFSTVHPRWVTPASRSRSGGGRGVPPPRAASLGKRSQASRGQVERGRQFPAPIGRLGLVEAGGDDQVDLAEAAQDEVVRLQADRGQVVPASPVEHPFGPPRVEDAQPCGHGQIVQSRHRPVPDDTGTGQHHHRGRGVHDGQRFLGRFHPGVLWRWRRWDQVSHRLIGTEGQSQLGLPRTAQDRKGGDQRLGRSCLDNVPRPNVDCRQHEHTVATVDGGARRPCTR